MGQSSYLAQSLERNEEQHRNSASGIDPTDIVMCGSIEDAMTRIGVGRSLRSQVIRVIQLTGSDGVSILDLIAGHKPLVYIHGDRKLWTTWIVSSLMVVNKVDRNKSSDVFTAQIAKKRWHGSRE